MLSIAPLTRKGCAMATKEIDGLLQFKDKNGDVNIVYPVTKAENVEGLFGENGKIPSDQLPDMDYLPLAGGTMTGSINMSGQAITNLKDPASDGDAVNKKFVDKSKPTYVSDTMSASKWDKSSKTYSFESSYPFASYDIEIQPSDACTELQFEAWSKSRIVGSISKNIAKAIGDVPTVDIPIILKAVKK